VPTLLAAVEAGRLPATDLDPAGVARRRAHANPTLRARAIELFPEATADRAAVVAKYRTAAAGDMARGRLVFAATCAGCHRLEDRGHEVGPDLRATVPGKSDADLATAIFDPNREIDPRYVSYVAELADGRQATGLLAADGPGHLTLRRADGAEDVIRRADLENLRSSGKSLMPDGLEASVSPAAFADLLAYLRAATRPPDRSPRR
jgi:putative heme-binding domain-containing protein